MRMRILFLGLLLGCIFGAYQPHLRATDNRIRFRHLTQEQGLSQATITCMVEDARGFLWVGTQDGLNRFDGYHFAVYRTSSQDPYSISENFISTLHAEANGTLWIGTRSEGINRYDPQTGRFYRYQMRQGDPNSLSQNYITSIYQDRHQVLWISTINGLNRLNPDGKTFTQYFLEKTTVQGSNVFYNMLEDKDGILWVGNRHGLCRFEPQSGTFKLYSPNPAQHYDMVRNPIPTILMDSAGRFWAGNPSGLYRFNPVNGTFTAIPPLASQPATPFPQVNCLFEDASQNLWVGTVEGLYRSNPSKNSFILYQSDTKDNTSLGLNVVVSLVQNRSGTLWVGTWGRGIAYYHPANQRFLTYDSNPQNGGFLTKDAISYYFEDRQGVGWVGFIDGGLDRLEPGLERMRVTHFKNNPKQPKSLGTGRVSSIFQDKLGLIWVGVESSGLHRFEPKTQSFSLFCNDPYNPTTISSNDVSSIAEDSWGRLWVATYVAGLNLMNRETNTFTRYFHQSDNPRSLGSNNIIQILPGQHGVLWLATDGSGLIAFDPQTTHATTYRREDGITKGPNNNLVLCLHQDTQGYLWLGTYMGGLNRFDPKTNTFDYFTSQQGLPNDVVYGILEDNQKCLWLSTNNGISRFNPHTLQFKNYSSQDGLTQSEFNNGAYFKNPKGLFFFGGMKGLSVFSPDTMKENTYIPPVVLTDFLIFNESVRPGPAAPLRQPIDATQQITLSYTQNMFSFEFTALDYTSPEKNQYAYRMEGFDQQWRFTNALKRYASYTNLDPGTYTFRVRGSNSDGIWNQQGVAVQITITPPLTQTWWFRLALVCGILLIAALLYRTRTRELAQRTRLNTELKTAHHAQMSIMPRKDPVIPGLDVSGICVPANEVGGDFFDYLWLDEKSDSLGIAVGDVSGKAMNAAMTAILSSGLLSARAAEHTQPHHLLTHINHPLYEKTDKRMFTALCLASIHLKTHQLRFVNAGLCHPLLKSRNTITLLRDGPPQIPLGVKANTVYRETTLPLQPDDVLIIFSDGIPETQNPEGGFFDYSRLIALLQEMDTNSLTAAQIVRQIVDTTQQFAGSMPQQDDKTMVVIKVISQPEAGDFT